MLGMDIIVTVTTASLLWAAAWSLVRLGKKIRKDGAI